MKQYLKDQLPTFLVGALCVVILVIVFRRGKDSGTELANYKIEELKKENKSLQHTSDSLLKVVAVPILIPNDSLQKVAIDLNKKVLYEIQKKRQLAIDTLGSRELQELFSRYQ